MASGPSGVAAPQVATAVRQFGQRPSGGRIQHVPGGAPVDGYPAVLAVAQPSLPCGRTAPGCAAPYPGFCV